MAAEPGPKPSKVGTPVESAGGITRLHLSGKGLRKASPQRLQEWLEKASSVPVHEVFKQGPWTYAFVQVNSGDAARFRESVHGAEFEEHHVSVSETRSRGGDKRAQEGEDQEPPAKKQRTSDETAAAAQMPRLKELKERAKLRKVHKRRESVVAKSCPLMEEPYDRQLVIKADNTKTAVRGMLKQVARACETSQLPPPEWTQHDWSRALKAPPGCGCHLRSPIGCPSEGLLGYRNKCEFTIALNEAGEEDLGFVLEAGEDGVVVADVSDVPPVPQQMKALCAALRDCIRASPFAVFDRRNDVRLGVWRVVTVRMTPSGDILVLVQTTTLSERYRKWVGELLVDALVTKQQLGVVSIYLQFSDDLTDAAKNEAPLFHIHGQEAIMMPLLGSVFALGPLSFWNPNTSTNAALYAQALDWLQVDEHTVLLDVCCGIGTYALLAAARGCKEAIGVDVSAADVEEARKNAKRLGVKNASFHVGKVEDVLPRLLGDMDTDAKVYAVIDPPRPGVHWKALNAMRRCHSLQRIVYVSCNPDSLAENAAKLSMPDEDDPFVPVQAVPVDTFPHTLQYEVIMHLERASKVPDPRSTGASQDAGPDGQGDAPQEPCEVPAEVA
mmetsp:Transcript_17427/g.52639  ORF Transcript_17427/g.52639 Transcript_17427/m.52639 type:complete len:612 (+) Transcript_17427:52-1887(+)